MTQDKNDVVVSAQTHFRGGDHQPKLSAADRTVRRITDGLSGTEAHRPDPKEAAEFVSEYRPENHVDSSRPYILAEEPDKRFRLVGLALGREPRVTLRSPDELQTGADNRVRITNTTSWPHCVHGHCIITYPDRNVYIGSGTMVNRHHVITAGHVVFSKANGGWATSIQFNAAQNDGSLPYVSAYATYLYSFKGWTDSQLRDYDTGMLILNRDLGNQTGWMGLITTSDGNLSNHPVTVEGYPGDKGGQQLWAATGPIVGVSAHQIQYNDYTKGGDSGAGVYGIWQGINLEHVCADHVAGPNGIPNTGSRLSRDKFDRIVNDWFPH
jgi:V8-like Glu-specific endopeptidase